MEWEILTLRSDLVAKVEEVLPKNDMDRISSLETRLDTLEELIKSNIKELGSLSQNIKELNSSHTTVAIDTSQLESLSNNVTANLQVANAEVAGSLAALRDEVATAAELENVKVKIRDMATAIARCAPPLIRWMIRWTN